MKQIISIENKNVVRTASLKEKKYRDMYGLYLVEGKRAVSDAISCGAEIESIYVCGNEEDFEKKSDSFEVFSVSEPVMKKICGTLTPQNIAATIKIPFHKLEAPVGSCLVLDRISDPGNLGTIVRTAAACGVKNIYLTGGADIYNPKTVRSSMGGLNHVKAVYATEEEIISLLKQSNIEILGADMSGENLFGFTQKKLNYALIIGSEADGISDKLKDACHKIISLPMEKVESLNAAVCASVMMYMLKYSKGNTAQ